MQEAKDEVCNIPKAAAEPQGFFRRNLRPIILAVFVVLVLLQFWIVRTAIERSSLLQQSEVEFSVYIPDAQVYHPGDHIRFTFKRTSKPSDLNDDYPLLLLTVDSFENQDTGEVFPGIMASRIIHQAGVRELHALRRIPSDATPGRYRFEGYASSQTNRLTRASYYSSEEFVVEPGIVELGRP